MSGETTGTKGILGMELKWGFGILTMNVIEMEEIEMRGRLRWKREIEMKSVIIHF